MIRFVGEWRGKVVDVFNISLADESQVDFLDTEIEVWRSPGAAGALCTDGFPRGP